MKAAFIDRDGTILSNEDHLRREDDYSPTFNVFKGIRMLKNLGFLPVIITNQSGVARGYYGEDFVELIKNKMGRDLACEGVDTFAHYYCPHHPTVGLFPYKMQCTCRKPEAGMVYKAAKEFDINLQESIVIGDSTTDYGLAKNAEINFYLVATGTGKKFVREIEEEKNPLYCGYFDNLFTVAESIAASKK
ncbi:MAG: HAD-IIIA family hydrolase [Nitrospinae bacterium]|nr:HAD-IIIA family hydrolase [Nitrospinota bacterium]